MSLGPSMASEPMRPSFRSGCFAGWRPQQGFLLLSLGSDSGARTVHPREQEGPQSSTSVPLGMLSAPLSFTDFVVAGMGRRRPSSLGRLWLRSPPKEALWALYLNRF